MKWADQIHGGAGTMTRGDRALLKAQSREKPEARDIGSMCIGCVDQTSKNELDQRLGYHTCRQAASAE